MEEFQDVCGLELEEAQAIKPRAPIKTIAFDIIDPICPWY
jgi:hypothetical protein